MNNMEIKVSVKDIPKVIEQLQQAEEKINNLQSKIDKSDELIETYKNERNIYKWLAETYIKKYNDSNCCRYEEDRDEWE